MSQVSQRNQYIYRKNRPYKTLTEALDLVRQSIQDEYEDALLYDYLVSIAPTQEMKDIIAKIRDDEFRHSQMFQEIYAYYTGQQIPIQNVQPIEPISFIDGIRKAVFAEVAAIEAYRDIHAGLPDMYYKDMVFEILTDELIHGDKFNYILNMYVLDMVNSTDPGNCPSGAK